MIEKKPVLPSPPVPLGVRGMEMWNVLQAKYEFDPIETNLAVEVCRTLDMIDALVEAVNSDGVTGVGSSGQPVLSSVVAEIRQQRLSYARLVTMLNLDAADVGGKILSPRAVSGSAAARARWSRQMRSDNA